MTNNIINLESLIELSARLNDTHDEKFILSSSLLSLMGKLRFLRACVLVPVAGNKLKIYLTKGKNTLENCDQLNIDSMKKLDPTKKNENVLFKAGFTYCNPIHYRSKLMAYICLGSRAVKGDLSLEERRYADLVSTITANALQSSIDYQSLADAKNKTEIQNQLLKTMFEISRDFSNLLSRNDIIKMLILSIMGQLMVNKFALFLMHEDGSFETVINRFEFLPSEKVLMDLSKLEKPLKYYDLETCCEVEEYMLLSKARIVSPMMVSGRSKGLLFIGKKMNGERFSNDNLQFIETLANMAMSSLENVRLFNEELEKKRLETELSMALEIQVNLLPKDNPKIKGYDIAGMSIPSRHVGGDYFDYIKLSGNRTLFCIADVSGKGMPAALIMANIQAALRISAPFGLSLPELTNRLNKIVYENTGPDKFVTFFVGILNSSDNTFTYTNAGHNPPMLLRSGKFKYLNKGGLILGVLDEKIDYKVEVFKLKRDDLLLMYTDGVVEAIDPKKNEFGVKRLKQTLNSNIDSPSDKLIAAIRNVVDDFAKGENQYDDLTLLAIRKV